MHRAQPISAIGVNAVAPGYGKPSFHVTSRGVGEPESNGLAGPRRRPRTDREVTGVRRRSPLPPCPASRGRSEARGRSLPRLAVDPDVAARLLDDPVHRRESQPCSLPLFLHREDHSRVTPPYSEIPRRVPSLYSSVRHPSSRRHALQVRVCSSNTHRTAPSIVCAPDADSNSSSHGIRPCHEFAMWYVVASPRIAHLGPGENRGLTGRSSGLACARR